MDYKDYFSDNPFEPSLKKAPYEPFCCNPKCKLHGKMVPPGLSYLNSASVSTPFKPAHKAAPNSPLPVSYETVHRYTVGTQLDGLSIKGKLCDTCMEVLRMFNGWP